MAGKSGVFQKARKICKKTAKYRFFFLNIHGNIGFQRKFMIPLQRQQTQVLAHFRRAMVNKFLVNCEAPRLNGCKWVLGTCGRMNHLLD